MIKRKLLASFFTVSALFMLSSQVFYAQTQSMTDTTQQSSTQDTTIQSDVTGIIEKDGSYYYALNGIIALDYNGIVETETGTFYLVNGKVNQSLTGLISYNNGHIYIKNGKLENNFTGLVTNPVGTYYVKQGKIDRSFTGFVWHEDAHYYMINGRWASHYTGLGTNPAGTYYVKQGKIDRSFTGFVWHENAHYYMVNGRWASHYTGLGSNPVGTYYVKQGKIDRSFTGFVWHEEAHYYMVNGRWASHYTGTGTNPAGTFYVKEGKIDRSFTDIVSLSNDDSLYFKNGKLQAKTSVTNIDQINGTYDIIVSELNVPETVKQILIPTWTEKNGQDDLNWHVAKKQSDGTYRHTIKIYSHKYEHGTYTSHVYLENNSGELGHIATKNVNIDRIFVNPIDNPEMTSWFGEVRHLILQDGRIRNDVHNGVDFVNGNKHAPIKAVASGKVIYSGWRGSAGMAVIIKHSDELYTYYYHLSSINVKLNDTVSQNQVLGIIGTTGDSTGIHLHFGVSKKLASDYIDPMIMLPALSK